MSEETWETISGESGNNLENLDKCVRYYPRCISVNLHYMNVTQEFCQSVKKLFTKKDIEGKVKEIQRPTETTETIEFSLSYITQLSSNKTKIRFVFTKKEDERWGSPYVNIVCCTRKNDSWNDFDVSTLEYGYHSRCTIDRKNALAKRLSSDYVVFVNSEGKPTKGPIFEITEEKGKVIITGSIKGITKKEFLEVFPAKKKKET